MRMIFFISILFISKSKKQINKPNTFVYDMQFNNFQIVEIIASKLYYIKLYDLFNIDNNFELQSIYDL